MKRRHGLLVSTGLVFALAGCVPAPVATSSPTPSPTKTAAATPTATPIATAAPLAVPDCETLLPVALAQAGFSPDTVFLGEIVPAEFGGRSGIPSIPVTLAEASPARVCSYGVPNSDGVFFVGAAAVTGVQRSTMQGELTSAGYLSTTSAGVTSFELAADGDVSSLAFTHLFSGDVWVFCDATSLDFTALVAQSVLDAMRTANPTAGI